MTTIAGGNPPYRNAAAVWAGMLILAALFGLMFRDVIVLMIDNWLGSEEYNYGLMVPFVSLFLIWQKRRELADSDYAGSWRGMGLLLAGLALHGLGELASLQIFQEYALLAVLLGGTWAVAGDAIFRRVWTPIFFIFFAIPLPAIFYHGLSAKLQLLSSQLGVAVIRLCDISVFLEGNVIDLGSLKLQVAEACNGLRYLFPLASVAFMCAYVYQAAWWKRALVFLSSLPVTLFMNSFRIGMIGVLVEYWGKSMAEGFLHDFEGWIVFMGCTALLVAEMWALARIGPDPRPLREVFGLESPEPWPAATRFRERGLPRQFWAAGAALLLGAGLSFGIQQRQEIVPERAAYAEFPLELGGWHGRRQHLEPEIIDALKFDDYLLADFARGGDPSPVSLYSAYYASQRAGESIHSPRTCLPGGGWQVMESARVVPDAGLGFQVNRVLIQKGGDRQLVYYWFRQRGRVITDEYAAKVYLLLDALGMNRTDGALLRLTTPVPQGADVVRAERRLLDFLGVLEPRLSRYIPD